MSPQAVTAIATPQAVRSPHHWLPMLLWGPISSPCLIGKQGWW